MQEEFTIAVLCSLDMHFEDQERLIQELERLCLSMAMGRRMVLLAERERPAALLIASLCREKPGWFGAEFLQPIPDGAREAVRRGIDGILDCADGVILISDVFVEERFCQAAHSAQERRIPLRQLDLVKLGGQNA